MRTICEGAASMQGWVKMCSNMLYRILYSRKIDQEHIVRSEKSSGNQNVYFGVPESFQQGFGYSWTYLVTRSAAHVLYNLFKLYHLTKIFVM